MMSDQLFAATMTLSVTPATVPAGFALTEMVVSLAEDP